MSTRSVCGYADPEQALDLGRAAVAELMTVVLTEWRGRGSLCESAIVLTWQDLGPGAGWGLVDALGRPKAPLYAVRRVLAPTAVLISDEGLCGLRFHLLHDGPDPFVGRLGLRVLSDAGDVMETAERQVEVEPHGALELLADGLLGGFRDLNRAYRFGPLGHDVVGVELRDAAGRLVGEACHLASGPARPRLPDLGLAARAAPDGRGGWSLTVSTALFAQSSRSTCPASRRRTPGSTCSPARPRRWRSNGPGPDRRPADSVRALNGHASAPIRVEDAA